MCYLKFCTANRILRKSNRKNDYMSGLSLPISDLILHHLLPVAAIADQRVYDKVHFTLQTLFTESLADIVSQIVPNKSTKEHVVYVGSRSEGLFIPAYVYKQKVYQSDMDTMTLLPNEYRPLSDGKPKDDMIGPIFDVEQLQLWECNDQDFDPLFVKLLVTNYFKDARKFEGVAVKRKYLDASIVLDTALEQGWDIQSMFKQSETTGLPYIAGPSAVTGNPDLQTWDNVLAFNIEGWPKAADEWISRRRQNNWPTESTIDTIFQSGYHLVPIGRSGKLLEWRLSFSIAERTLANTLTDYQRKIYILLKILHKWSFNEPKSISSYHLKNVFFWACEKVPKQRWSAQNEIELLSLLLDDLLHCIAQRKLPHYFVSEGNLLKYTSPKHLKETAQKITYARKNILRILLAFDNNVMIMSLLTRQKCVSLFEQILYKAGTRDDVPTQDIQSCLTKLIRNYIKIIKECEDVRNNPEKLAKVHNIFSYLSATVLDMWSRAGKPVGFLEFYAHVLLHEIFDSNNLTGEILNYASKTMSECHQANAKTILEDILNHRLQRSCNEDQENASVVSELSLEDLVDVVENFKDEDVPSQRVLYCTGMLSTMKMICATFPPFVFDNLKKTIVENGLLNSDELKHIN